MTRPPAAWTPFLREAGIAAESLGEGLTALRGMNHVQHGSLSHALFAMSIGLERLLKLIVLVDYRVELGEYPTLTVFKNDFGHKISSLFESAEVIRTRSPYEAEVRWELPDRAIALAILGVLTEFATSTRYYNLDVLAGSPRGRDPLAAWSSDVGDLVMEKHGSKRQRSDETSSFVSQLSPMVLIRQTGLDGEPIDSLDGAVRESDRNQTIARWSTFHVAAMVRYLAELLRLINRKAHEESVNVPFLHEFFSLYENDDVLLKRRKTFRR